MKESKEPLDVLLIVPFEPMTGYAFDPTIRQTLGAHFGMPLGGAMAEFENFLGHPLNFRHWHDHELYRDDPTAFMFSSHRSLTAVTLATHLEAHGLNWRAVDPGVQELRYWRRCFERMRANPPRVLAISTTYVMIAPWLKALCALARKILPESKILIGGSYYITSTRDFLSLDADMFCIGEGEERLPQIVEAVRDGESLDRIPGLYVRRDDGTLKYTGPVRALVLDDVQPADWGLAGRIEPYFDLNKEPTYYHVETQRGCAFRCEFCTYHTMTPLEKMSPDTAVEAIMQTGVFDRGYIFIVDATASFPPSRWKDILVKLAERGGSPLPLLAFARVSDINDEVAALMARAGVQDIYIGQESGDQRILDAMKKMTKAAHVPTAVAALAKHGIGAQLCFMHGFPGETTESLRNTRNLMLGLNRGYESHPVVFTYVLTPFLAFDFATVSQHEHLSDVHHPMGYDHAPFTPQRAGEEVLATLIATSQVSHAPVCSFVFDGQAHFLFTATRGPERAKIHRWLKAIERGVAIFLERDLEGKKPNLGELRAARETILNGYSHYRPLRSALFRMGARGRARQAANIRAEWLAERENGPGRLTRTLSAFCTYRDFGNLRDAIRGWKAGTYPEVGSKPCDVTPNVEVLSTELIDSALPKSNKRSKDKKIGPAQVEASV